MTPAKYEVLGCYMKVFFSGVQTFDGGGNGGGFSW